VLGARSGRARLLYGGSARPGLSGQLGPAVDGLFLSRFAHGIAALVAVIEEVSQPAGPR
jgi:triosephosphate isomerase